MAELGQTSDPRALVPGDVPAVGACARDLDQQGTRLAGIGAALARVQVPSWSGAASSAFDGAHAQQCRTWYALGDDLGAAGRALRTYSEALGHAQDQAREALALWERGEHATTTARAQYDDAAAARAALPAAPPAAPSDPFVDPGQQLRRQAQDQLARARAALLAAGDAAAGTLSGLFARFQPAVIDGSAHLLGADAHAEGMSFADGTLTFGAASAEAYLAKADGSWSDRVGGVAMTATGSAFAGADASADASLGKDGLAAHAGVFAGARAGADYDATYGPVSAGAAVDASAGASADADLGVGRDGVSAEAGAFAGAKGGGDVHGDIAGIGGKGTAEAWAGAGATADVHATYEHGTFTIGGALGASLGVGGKLGGEVTVDPGKVVSSMRDAADTLGSWLP